MSIRPHFILPLGLALVAGAPAALGQTALGNGQGLYRDLQQRNPLAITGRDYAAEAKNRNAIVFGRAPGGLSFRGGLGYRDPAEFLGSLGSQSLHSFINETAYSAQISQGIRAQQAMDQQRALSVGEARRPNIRGSLETPRGATSSGANLATPAYRQSPGGSFGGTGLRVDPLADRRENSRRPGNALSPRRMMSSAGGDFDTQMRGTGLGTGAAFAGNRTTRAAQGSEYGSGGMNERLGVTGRLGGRVSEIETDSEMGLGAVTGSGRTLAGARRDSDKLTGLAPQQQRPNAALTRPGAIAGNRVPGIGEDARAQIRLPPIRTAYDDLKDRLDRQMGPVGVVAKPEGADRAATDTTTPAPVGRAAWEKRIAELRGELTPELDRAGRSLKLMTPAQQRSFLAAARAGKQQPGAKKAEPEPGKAPPEVAARLDPQTLKMIRDAAANVQDLAPIGAVQGRDFFGEHMKIGQVLLEQGQYFDAEERFTRALAVKPGDVTAEVGRIHAELGAGLVLSAGQNLRRLLSAHPEAAGLRYSAKLLPSGERAEAVIEQLRDNLAGQGRLGRESALLLAYLGFQTRSMDTARTGIDAIAKTAENDPEARVAGDARLAELLRGIWLDPSLYENKDAPPNQ